MMEENQFNQMTMRDYIKVLFRHKGIMFLTMVTILATAVLAGLMTTPLYESQVKMLVTGHKQAQAEYYTDIGVTGSRGSQMITITQSEIVFSDPVLERAVSVLGLAKKPLDYEKQFASPLKKPFIQFQVNQLEKKFAKLTEKQQKAYRFRLATEDLRDRLDVEPVRDTNLFVIKVKDYNPIAAAVLANVVSRSYVIFDIEQQLAELELTFGEKNLKVVQLKEAIEKMREGLNGAPLPPIEAIGPATVKIIEQAKVPLKPVTIPRFLLVILAFIMAVVLSVIVAFIVEYSDQTFKSAHAVVSVLGVKFLGSLPKKTKPHHFVEVAKEIYVELVNQEVKSLVVTSAEPDDGVTRLTAHLGDYIAEHLRKKVLLIDTHLDNPLLHHLFDLPADNPPLDLKSESPLKKNVRQVSPHLHILSPWLDQDLSRPAYSSHDIHRFIEEAQKVYDHIFIDSEPVAQNKDTAIIATASDSVLMIIAEGKTRRYVVRNAIRDLRSRKSHVLGVVLNQRKYVIPKFIYDRV
jgi:capsular polysaccharide biosynthesis protein